MKLTVQARPEAHKTASKRIRREGNIPAVLYAPGQENQLLVVHGPDFHAALREIRGGRLPTTRFELHMDGKVIPVLVKEIQYHPTTYQVVHLDFLALQPKVSVNVKVPLMFLGAERSPGVKLGGNLRPVLHHVPVSCPSDQIPQQFDIDVSHLEMFHVKRVGEIAMPKGVRPLLSDKEVLVVVAKR